jgi:Uncharacterised methyltransferase family (DUF6094)/Helicase conserved C-terminal domain
MRLAGQAKLGYYPTPALTMQMIPSWLMATKDGPRRVFDPCCGKGEALATIAQAYPAETFGIELSDYRAEAAQGRLDNVHNCAYENAVTSVASYSLILLNPPYDGESFTGGGKRVEEKFLVNEPTTKRLVLGGVLVYLIPYYSINVDIARHLAGWYEDLRCYKLPAVEYEVFKQVVIFGRKKDRYTTPSNEKMERVLAWEQGTFIDHYKDKEIEEERGTKEGVKLLTRMHKTPVYAPLPYLETGHGEYELPTINSSLPFVFKYHAFSQEARLREAMAAIERLDSSQIWKDKIPSLEPQTYEPAITPKQGHIAMQVSGGMLGTNVITENNGEKVAIKGWTRKILVQNIEDNGGDTTHTKVIEDERFENALTLLDMRGNLTFTTDPNEIGLSLDKYVNQLKEQILESNQPIYDFNPEPWEWAVFNNLSKGRRLPGRIETGLTDFQKHLAIAQGRLMLRKGGGFLNGEMGSGKTTISIAVADYLETAFRRMKGSKKSPYPVLVMGPGIVTGKKNWLKEVPDVIPGAQAQVVTIGAKPVARPMKIGNYLEYLGIVLDQDEYMGKNAKACMYAITLLATAQSIMIPTNELAWSLKQAESNPPRRRTKAPAPNLLDGRIGGFMWIGMEIPRDKYNERQLAQRYSVAEFLREQRSGLLPRKAFAVMSFETGKLGSARVPAHGIRYAYISDYVFNKNTQKEEPRLVLRQFATCPHCGRVISEEYDMVNGSELKPLHPQDMNEFIDTKRRFCQAPMPKWGVNPETGEEEWLHEDADGNPYVCGRPLFEETKLRRESAAAYIKKKAKNAFGFNLTDEVHEAKGKGTGVGWAYGTLVNACRWSLGLTGTLFGGYSTSIFMLWYRMIGEVRNQFDFIHGDRRWAKIYGLIRKVYYLEENGKTEEDGTFIRTRYKNTVSERPGISPAILRYGLPYCTFSSLNDIGLPLPQYSEEVVRIPMTQEMREQYKMADGSATKSGLFAWALDMMKKPNGQGAISVWLNTALNRPDAMFRSEAVEFNPRISGKGKYAIREKMLVTALDEISGIAPKEQWLIDQCLVEKQHTRKTLVYIRQTGKRDIQERIKSLLEENGLRVGVLKPSMKPARRATWIFNNAPKFDVLLTNAKLVKVGLNLTQFSTGIFYEMDWSLYVVWQAMRRLYRPGAPKPVMMYFPVYEGTMEEHLQSLVGQKMASAQMFYGDEVAGALTDNDSGDLLNDLVRVALGQLKVGRAEKMFSMGTDGTTSNSAYGSVVLPSQRIEGVWGQEAIIAWAIEHGLDLESRQRRKKKVPQGQQSFF